MSESIWTGATEPFDWEPAPESRAIGSTRRANW